MKATAMVVALMTLSATALRCSFSNRTDK